MPASRLTVVLSQGQSENPVKRGLEEALAAGLIMEPGVDVSIIPHLYDLNEDHTGLLYLRSVQRDMVVLAWLYPRGAFWELDRVGVKGHMGTVLLKKDDDEPEDDDELDENDEREAHDEKSVLGAVDVPDRHIYCLDLRDFDSPDPYIQEIRRIAAESRVQTVSLQLGGLGRTAVQSSVSLPSDSAVHPFTPSSVHPLSSPPDQSAAGLTQWLNGSPSPGQLARYLDPAQRRWHPVIDYSRCTNCLECIDFCLFGVYGVDPAQRILVEEADNCKKGCPACSRVCPEHAIMFPMHKTPEIAGAATGSLGGLKIDLSKLFGGSNAMEMAAIERDVELVRDGRQAVGTTVGMPKRQAGKPTRPKDELDTLIDQLDEVGI